MSNWCGSMVPILVGKNLKSRFVVIKIWCSYRIHSLMVHKVPYKIYREFTCHKFLLSVFHVVIKLRIKKNTFFTQYFLKLKLARKSFLSSWAWKSVRWLWLWDFLKQLIVSLLVYCGGLSSRTVCHVFCIDFIFFLIENHFLNIEAVINLAIE